MSLEQWMESRKMVILREKKQKLFETLPQTMNFHSARAELYKLLSRIDHEQRGLLRETRISMGIPILA